MSPPARDPVITVSREYGRIVIVVIRRRRTRLSLSVDEAERLEELLRRQLPRLTVTRRA